MQRIWTTLYLQIVDYNKTILFSEPWELLWKESMLSTCWTSSFSLHPLADTLKYKILNISIIILVYTHNQYTYKSYIYHIYIGITLITLSLTVMTTSENIHWSVMTKDYFYYMYKSYTVLWFFFSDQVWSLGIWYSWHRTKPGVK